MMQKAWMIPVIVIMAMSVGCEEPSGDAEASQQTAIAEGDGKADLAIGLNASETVAAKPRSAATLADVSPTGAVGSSLIDPLPQVIVAMPEAVELGEFSTSEKKQGTLTLKNTSDEAVTIISARGSCGCTTTDFKPNTTIDAGGEIEITVQMDGKGRAQRLEKTLTFTIDGRPPLRVPVRAETISYVQLTPDPLSMDEGMDSLTITLTSRDDQPFLVTRVQPMLIDALPTEAATRHVLKLNWGAFWENPRTTKVTFGLDHPLCSDLSTNVTLNPAQRKRFNEIMRANRDGQGLPTKDPDRPLTGDQLARYIKMGRGADVLTYIGDGKGQASAVDQSGVPLISVAAQEGDVDTMLALIDLGADIESTDRVSRSPLMYAARSENPQVIDALLDAGADMSVRDQLGNEALAWAAGFGTADGVQVLLDAGADVNVTDNVLGYTPLIWASGFGDAGSIPLLLEAGADVDVHDRAEGRTPLMHAVRTGDTLDAMRSLVGAGANVNALDNVGRTALHVGAGHPTAPLSKVEFLIEAGCDPSVKDVDGKTPLDLAMQRTDEEGGRIVAFLSQGAAVR